MLNFAARPAPCDASFKTIETSLCASVAASNSMSNLAPNSHTQAAIDRTGAQRAAKPTLPTSHPIYCSWTSNAPATT